MHPHSSKNFSTGEIIRFETAGSYPGVGWLPDNRLIYQKYSHEAKENVIYIYDPKKREITKLFNGSIWGGYYAQLNTLVFVKNETTRQYHAYNFSTQETKALGYDREAIDAVYIQSEEPEKVDPIKQIDMPLELSDELIATLPILHLEEKTIFEHIVVIEGKEYPVNRIITIDGQHYVGIRHLMEPLGIEMTTTLDNDKLEFIFTANGKTLLLENKEFSPRFINLRGILMFRFDTLQELGITITEVKKVL